MDSIVAVQTKGSGFVFQTSRYPSAGPARTIDTIIAVYSRPTATGIQPLAARTPAGIQARRLQRFSLLLGTVSMIETIATDGHEDVEHERDDGRLADPSCPGVPGR